jgi:HupE / UreJ protein
MRRPLLALLHRIAGQCRIAVTLLCLAALCSTDAPAQLTAQVSPMMTAATAHAVGQSYIFLRVYDDSLVVTFELTTKDLDRRLQFGWDQKKVTKADVEAKLPAIRTYIEDHVMLATSNGQLTPTYQSFDMLFLEIADFVLVRYVIKGTRGIPSELAVTYDAMFDVDANHRNYLVIAHNWKTGTFNSDLIAGVFTPDAPSISIDLSKSSTWRGFVAMIQQGIWHIWIGIDHILFLVALALPAVMVRTNGRWEPVSSFRKALVAIVTIVSFFTLAHSVTLSLAALDVITLPSRFVESVIAGSIAVAAAANLLPQFNVREAFLAFAFGLFHGFGFATVLGDLGLGREHMVLSLLGFNIGVELGQLAIICAVFPVLFLLRRTAAYGLIVRIGSIGLIALALLWVFERAFEFNVPVVPLLKSIVGAA